MSRFANYVGKIQIKVGGYEKELTPKIGDNRQFLKIISNNAEDKPKLFDEFSEFMYTLIEREEDIKDDKDRDELKLYIDTYVIDLLNEYMIASGMTSREELEKAKKEALQAQKNLLKKGE